MTTRTAKDAIRLLRVDHIALNVTDIARSREFYSRVLGFRVTSESTTRGKNQHIEMEAGDICLALFETADLDLKAAHEIFTRKGYFHMAFEVAPDQFDSVLEALHHHNVELDGKPRNHGGGPSVYFFDPDGYQIELHANSQE